MKNRFNGKRLMKRIAGRLAGPLGVLLALCLLGSIAAPVLAVPQMPHQFWGSVTINGAQAPTGTIIKAEITGAPDATTTVDASGNYNFQVPADDPDTSVKEGGVAGDTIQFYVGTTAAQTSTFAYGGITNLDLTIAAPPPAAQKLIGSSTAGSTVDGTNAVVYSRFIAEATGTVSQIKVYSLVSGSVKVAIYEDAAGEPGNKITGNDTGQAVILNQWNNLSIGNTDVVKDTAYWLGTNISVTGAAAWQGSTGTRRYKSAAYSTWVWPASAGTGFVSHTGVEAIAGWGTIVLPTPPATPTPLPPTTPITFSWTASAGATKYQLQVNTDPGFGSGTSLFDSEITATTQVVPVPIGTTCYWRVRAGNAGGWSAWSSTGTVLP